jgi:AmmeMemoRadiSam system protein A
MIPEADRRQLLAIARDAIAATLGRASSQTHPANGSLSREAGAFVTLHTRGELRGCIGQVEADRPLADVVASCAVSAARSDPRFPPVTADELDALDIEVSVLGGFEAVHSIAEIEVGRHGLLIERDWRRGLLLPQVATEWGWDAPTFVAQTCRKAGLPRDAWPSGGASLYRFEAEVFGERELPRNANR